LIYIYEGGDRLYVHTGNHDGRFQRSTQSHPRKTGLDISAGVSALEQHHPVRAAIGNPAPGNTATGSTTDDTIAELTKVKQMADASNEQGQHRRPHPQPMAGPYLEFDLAREVKALHSEPAWSSGQNAKTLVKYDDFRVVLTALKARARLPGHRTDGRISIQTLAGHIQVRAEGRTFDLRTGSLLALDQGLAHDVEALEESAFLLSIAWPR
jgi:quercetin dioxygenase-like cupin family protein